MLRGRPLSGGPPQLTRGPPHLTRSADAARVSSRQNVGRINVSAAPPSTSSTLLTGARRAPSVQSPSQSPSPVPQQVTVSGQSFGSVQQRLLAAAIQFLHRNIKTAPGLEQRMEQVPMTRSFYEYSFYKTKAPDARIKVFGDSLHNVTPMQVCSFVLGILHQGVFGVAELIISIIYLSSFKRRTGVTLHMGTWRPLIITSLLVADKMWDDKPIRLRDMSRLFPVVSDAELKQLEHYFLSELEFNVVVTPIEFSNFCEFLLVQPVQSDFHRAVAESPYAASLRSHGAAATLHHDRLPVLGGAAGADGYQGQAWVVWMEETSFARLPGQGREGSTNGSVSTGPRSNSTGAIPAPFGSRVAIGPDKRNAGLSQIASPARQNDSLGSQRSIAGSAGTTPGRQPSLAHSPRDAVINGGGSSRLGSIPGMHNVKSVAPGASSPRDSLKPAASGPARDGGSAGSGGSTLVNMANGRVAAPSVPSSWESSRPSAPDSSRNVAMGSAFPNPKDSTGRGPRPASTSSLSPGGAADISPNRQLTKHITPRTATSTSGPNSGTTQLLGQQVSALGTTQLSGQQGSRLGAGRQDPAAMSSMQQSNQASAPGQLHRDRSAHSADAVLQGRIVQQPQRASPSSVFTINGARQEPVAANMASRPGASPVQNKLAGTPRSNSTGAQQAPLQTHSAAMRPGGGGAPPPKVSLGQPGAPPPMTLAYGQRQPTAQTSRPVPGQPHGHMAMVGVQARERSSSPGYCPVPTTAFRGAGMPCGAPLRR